MKLIIIRHGQSEGNFRKIAQGQLDFKLTEKGIQQAVKTASKLSEEKIDAIYSSDLVRAQLTAEKISGHHNLDVISLKELREQNKGSFQGQSKEIYHQAILNSSGSYSKFKPEGGESLLEVQERVKKFYNEIVDKYEDKTVVMVSHGAVLTSLILGFLGKNLDEYKNYHPSNCAISIIEDGNITLLNSTTHLEQ